MPESNSNDPRNDPRFWLLRTDFEEVFFRLFYRLQFEDGDTATALNACVNRFETLLLSATGPIFDDNGCIPPMLNIRPAEIGSWFGFSDRPQPSVLRTRASGG